MAVDKPAGGGARNCAVANRQQLPTNSQLPIKMAAANHWTRRSRASGRVMNVKRDERQFKGVRRGKPAAYRRGITVSFGSSIFVLDR